MPRPLDGDWRDEFAIVYETAARHGFRPRDCDEMEIWELASALGANRADDSDPLIDAEGLSWNGRRALALAKGLPEPSWDDEAVSPQERAAQLRLMQNAPQALLPPD